jgi:hypothetical protein
VNPRNRILIAVLAAVVALGGYYMEVLKPKRQEAADLQTKIGQKQSDLAQAQQLLAANTRARDSYRAAYAAVVRLGKAVPSDDDVRSLLVQLNTAAKSSNVDFRSIAVSSAPGQATSAIGPSSASAASQLTLPPGATVGPAGFPIEPFQFSFKGQFFHLGDFFRRLHGFVKATNQQLSVSGRLMSVDSLNLAPDTTGFPNIRATVGATTYLVSPLEGATAGATSQGPAGTPGAATSAAPAAGAAPASPSTSAPAPTTATSTGAIR